MQGNHPDVCEVLDVEMTIAGGTATSDKVTVDVNTPDTSQDVRYNAYPRPLRLPTPEPAIPISVCMVGPLMFTEPIKCSE